MGIFSLLATPLGFIMRLIHMVVGNYGWVIIIFTFLVRILMFPLSLKQQKSTARTQAYQPMIQELQKKWANDKQRQQQELQKFYEENNIKMTAGCAPMLVNMLVLFGIIAVIQAPLNHILEVPQEQIDNGVAVVQHYEPELEIEKDTYTLQSRLIGKIKADPVIFTQGVEVTGEDGTTTHKEMDATEVKKIVDFDFQFLGLDLSEAPTLNLNRNLIMPILSILTMFGSQIVIMRASGQQQGGKSMWVMTIVMGVMFGFFAFRVPLGFSLYYTISNVVMTLQQLLLRKLHDPAKVREEIEREIEEKRLAKKAKKKVTVREADGSVVSLDLSDADMARLRLKRAREMDAKLYGLGSEEEDANARAATEKARAQDEARYGSQTYVQQQADDSRALPAPEKTRKNEKGTPGAPAADEEHREAVDANVKEEAAGTGEEAPAGAENQDQAATQDKAYKPGRRKRARQNKEKAEEASFAQREMEAEEKTAVPTNEKEESNA